MIREPTPQEEPTEKEVLEGKGKKKVKRALTTTFRDSTPFPLKRARRKQKDNKLREEARL